MLKIYRHPKFWYELESVTRFIDVEYVNEINQADYVEIAQVSRLLYLKGLQSP